MPEAPTSFIPKRVLTQVPDPRRPRPANIFMVIAVAIFVISLLFYGGAFFYKKVLADEINRPCQESSGGVTRCGLVASVAREEQNIDRATILLLQRIDYKFKIAGEVVSSHKSVLPVFGLLEEKTLPSIRYTHFGFTDKGIEIDGNAGSYEDIAVQTQIFAADRLRIRSFIFSNLDLDGTGRVSFKLSMNLEPGIDAYSKAISAAS